MTDREKVIKGLKIERECVSRDCDRNCAKCDLVQEREWLLSVYDDAIELLKEQEPVMWTYDGDNCFKCSNCDFHINDEVYYLTDKPINFCPGCGRAVKWDD